MIRIKLNFYKFYKMKNNKTLKLPSISLPIFNNNISRRQNIYFLNSLKNFKIKRENSKNNSPKNKKDKNKSIKTQSIRIINMSKKKTIDTKRTNRNKKRLKLIPNFSFKNLYEVIKKNKLKKSASYNNINTIEKEKPDFESNFRKLNNEANIYTSEVNYIKNTKMLLLDRYIYDNNKYKPDRLGLFDMSDFTSIKYKGKKIIKGHIYYNHNKYQPNNHNNQK